MKGEKHVLVKYGLTVMAFMLTGIVIVSLEAARLQLGA